MAASRANFPAAGARPSTLRFAPENQALIQRGIATLERVLGPTLGPGGRAVACARIGRPSQPPELLDDGATIARRMTGLPERFSNMGFMLARHAAWRMHAEQHDGATTAVLLLAAAHRELVRLQAAGHNRVELNEGVEWFIAEAVAEIERRAEPLDPAGVDRIATAMAGDPAIAAIVGDSLAALGPDGVIVTRASTGRELSVDYVEGALWESTAVSAPALGPDPTRRIRLDRPRVLLWDGDIVDPRALAAACDRLAVAGARSIVIVARSFSTEAMGLVHRNAGSPIGLHPVLAPHDGVQQEWAFGDLVALLGGRAFAPAAGDALDRIAPEDAGSALRVTLGARFLNIMAERGRSAAIGARIDGVRMQMAATEDEKTWAHHQLRIGRLRQGFGVIWVGAATESERDVRLQAVERCLRSLRAATAGGVVPGAGRTLLDVANEAGKRAGCPGSRAAAAACEAPAAQLAANAGLDASWAVARARQEPAGVGLDVTTGRFVDLRQSGILEPAETLALALRIGLSTAVLAGDCGLLIHRPVRLSSAEIRP